MDNSLIILRGVPGSGKSSFASLIARGDESIICCADDYFMKDGEYRWDRTKICDAHAYCYNKCENLMKDSAPLVIVANTNVRESEFKPYMDMAGKYGYKTFSVVVENRHGNDSVHNVPSETISSMKNKFNISL